MGGYWALGIYENRAHIRCRRGREGKGAAQKNFTSGQEQCKKLKEMIYERRESWQLDSAACPLLLAGEEESSSATVLAEERFHSQTMWNFSFRGHRGCSNLMPFSKSKEELYVRSPLIFGVQPQRYVLVWDSVLELCLLLLDEEEHHFTLLEGSSAPSSDFCFACKQCVPLALRAVCYKITKQKHHFPLLFNFFYHTSCSLWEFH